MFRLFGYLAAATTIFMALVALGVFISPQDDLKPADAIVAVSGGDTLARTNEAIKLYQEGWASRIIFSGAALDRYSPSNARAMREIALSQGIPRNAIYIDELAATTEENADQVATVILSQKYDTIILVTSPYHQRRAYLEFRDHLGGNVKIINHSALDDLWSRRGWWRTPVGWYITVRELPKVIFVMLR